MGKCQCCNRDMNETFGCDFTPIIHHGKKYRPIKVGDPGDFYFEKEKSRCGDCGAVTGHYHHVGCDLERCPVCEGQLLSCGCNDADNLYHTIRNGRPTSYSELEEQAAQNLIPIILKENGNKNPADLWFRYIFVSTSEFKDAFAIYQITKVTATYCDMKAVFISGMDYQTVRTMFPHFRYDYIVPEWGLSYRLRRSHVQNLLRHDDHQMWSGIKAELHDRSKVLRVIETFRAAQKDVPNSKFARICPRCGEYKMSETPSCHALSRHADVYICDSCGTDEAVRDWNQLPLPLEEWACAAMME